MRTEAVVASKLFLNVGLGGSVCKTVRSHLQASLKRLQTVYADLYYLHRMGSVPVEKVAEAMGQLIDEGLIRGWGLSQADVDIIERAQRVTPLSAVTAMPGRISAMCLTRFVRTILYSAQGSIPRD